MRKCLNDDCFHVIFTNCGRYLGQLLDGDAAISSIRKGVNVLEQHVTSLVRLALTLLILAEMNLTCLAHAMCT